jgi:hypothetical protein
MASRLDKLGVKGASTVAVVGKSDAAFLDKGRARGAGADPPPNGQSACARR